MTPGRHVVIFARAPRLGTGKRRLARGAGELTAWRFHRLNTGRLLRRLAPDPRWTTWLAVTPDTAVRDPRALWPVPVRLVPQGRGDLGARMKRVMRTLPRGPLVIVGSDVPDVRAAHLARAFDALGRHDAVLGPADDGGYWLVGLKRRPVIRAPFEGVRWGSPSAMADTVENLRALRLSVAFLDTLPDVDTEADLRPDIWRTL